MSSLHEENTTEDRHNENSLMTVNFSADVVSHKVRTEAVVSVCNEEEQGYLVHQTDKLIRESGLPCYLRPHLLSALTTSFRQQQQLVNDEKDSEALLVQDQDGLLDGWVEKFATECKGLNENNQAEEMDLPEIYHSLIHSPALDTLLQLEGNYAKNISDVVNQRNRAVEVLHQRQMKEMDKAISSLGTKVTDQYVNNLATEHVQKIQDLEDSYDKEIGDIKTMQKRDYKDYLLQLHQEMLKASAQGKSLPTTSRGASQSFKTVRDSTDENTYSTQQESLTDSVTKRGKNMMRKLSNLGSLRPFRAGSTDVEEDNSPVEEDYRLEESFTVYLGTQLKTMHNIRLLTGEPLDVCLHNPGNSEADDQSHAQRLMSALSLYSNKLDGMLLLVDNRLNSFSGIKRDFAAVCEQSADFQFPDLQSQLATLQRDLRVACGLSADADLPESAQPCLGIGDFYITRHSNIAVHCVFHLVCDDEIMRDSLNARNLAIIGLRNVLRSAFQNNITTMSIPLLLVHNLTEDMSSKWCVKRAELVLKCVKGFIMENSAFGRAESRTIQFIVPKGTSVKLFDQFSDMISSIFRVSSTLSLRETR